MGTGWIKLHRSIQDCWIWGRKEPFDYRSAWIDLLLTANHSDKKILFNGELITVKRGQILTSIRKLSAKWKWSKNKTYRFLNLLESDAMLERKSNKDRTLLTIVNYGVYQDCKDTNGHTNEHSNEDTNEYSVETPTDTPTRTGAEPKQECKEDKNVKNVKNEKNVKKGNTPPISPSEGEEESKPKKPKEQKKNVTNKELLENLLVEYCISGLLEEALMDWLSYKAERNFHYKDKGLETLIKTISKNAQTYGVDAVVDAINQSIASGYQGITFSQIRRNIQSAKNGNIDWDKV